MTALKHLFLIVFVIIFALFGILIIGGIVSEIGKFDISNQAYKRDHYKSKIQNMEEFDWILDRKTKKPSYK